MYVRAPRDVKHTVGFTMCNDTVTEGVLVYINCRNCREARNLERIAIWEGAIHGAPYMERHTCSPLCSSLVEVHLVCRLLDIHSLSIPQLHLNSVTCWKIIGTQEMQIKDKAPVLSTTSTSQGVALNPKISHPQASAD